MEERGEGGVYAYGCEVLRCVRFEMSSQIQFVRIGEKRTSWWMMILPGIHLQRYLASVVLPEHVAPLR